MASIQQGLSDGNPDIDAIYRLAHEEDELNLSFTQRAPIAIPSHVFSPCSARHILFSYEALWGLLLPVTTTSRVGDIWRGYVVQRLLFDIGGSLVFTLTSNIQVGPPLS